MSDLLLLELPLVADQPVQWLYWRGEAVAAQGSLAAEALAELALQYADVPCYALVSGQAVSHHRIVLPKGGRIGLAALPFQLEDRISSDLDSVHYAHGEIRPHRPVDVLVIDRELISGYRRCLLDAGLKVQALLPDYAMLPVNTLVVDHQRVTMNLPAVAAGLDSENVSSWWQLAAADAAELDVRLYTAGEHADEVTLPLPATAHYHHRLEALARCCQPWPLNLLSGGYQLGRERASPLGALRWPAALLVVALLLHWLSLGLATADNHRQVAALDQAMDTLYQDTFPGSRVVNARSQMRSQLNALEGAGEQQSLLLPWLEKLARASQSRAAPTLTQLNFESDPQLMKLAVKADGFETVDAWVAALSAQGLNVSRGGFAQQDGGVSGQISVRREAP